MRKTTFFILFILVLYGCTTTPENLSILTPQITKLARYTKTPLPRPTRTPTLTALVSINRAATANTIGNWRVCDRAEVPRLESDLSPNKEWLLVTCGSDKSTGNKITKVFRLDGSLSWDISFYEVFGASAGWHNGTMEVVHWTKDGKYLYIRPSLCCIDSPGYVFFNFFKNSISLYRLDLSNGRLTTTLRPTFNNLFSWYATSFSSTGKYLAYVHADNVRKIYIQNIQTGELKEISLEENYIASGHFAWSDDDKNLVFVAAKQDWKPWVDTQPQDSVSYFMFEIETGILQHLFDQHDIYVPNWVADDKISFDQLLGDKTFLFDLQNNSLLFLTPTPSE